MAVADRHGFPLSVHAEGASPHEVTLVEPTLDARFTDWKPVRLIGDRTYDSDPLDEALREKGVELIAPHRVNRVKPQDSGWPRSEEVRAAVED